MAYWIQIGKRLNIPNHTNTMRLKDKAAPLVTTKEIMPIKNNVTRLFNIICLFSKNSFLTDFAQSQASKAILKLNKEIQIVSIMPIKYPKYKTTAGII